MKNLQIKSREMGLISAFFGAAFIMILGTASGFSQPIITGRSSGLAGSCATGMFSVDALGWNPANLGLKANPEFRLCLPGAGLSFGNNSMSPRFIGETFVEDARLTDKQIADILSQLKTKTLDINTLLAIPVFGLAQGRVAFNVNAQLNSHFALPKDLFELMFRGPVKDQVSKFDNVQSESASWWAAAFSVGQPLPHPDWLREFSAGATIKYLGGLAMQRLDNQRGQVLLTEESIYVDGYGKTLESTRGSGWGLDFGFSGVMAKSNLKVGLTLGNLFEKIWWRDVTVREAQFYRDSGLNPDSLGRPEYWNWEYFFGQSDTTYKISSTQTDLPTYLILSFSRPFLNERIELFGSYFQGWDEAFGQSLKPLFAIGSEFRYIPFLPLRMGAALGGREELVLAGGFGLAFPGYQIDIGASWQRGILDDAKGFSVAVSNYIGVR
ncbi:MAG: DUF5723 family protein [Calditrichota bacterium]